MTSYDLLKELVEDLELGAKIVTLDGDGIYERCRRHLDALKGDPLEAALQNVYNVLGPKVPAHVVASCDGCAHEWGEAIRIVREALGDRLKRYPGDNHDGGRSDRKIEPT